MDQREQVAAARALLAGLPTPHVAQLGREQRRRALPGRSARPCDVAVAVVPGGVWLDVAGRAGVLFSADEWAGLVSSALAVLVEALGHQVDTGGEQAVSPG